MSERLEVGSRLGLLVLLAPAEVSGRAGWLVRCDCGREKVVKRGHLRPGRPASCGCAKRALIGAAKEKHGRAHRGRVSAEHRTWARAKTRCMDSSDPLYGGRGIAMCSRWAASFECFLEDMGPRPSPRHSIDRIDVNGNYEPGNCRWATAKEQANNRRQNVRLTIGGEVRTLTEWCRLRGVGVSTAWFRLRQGRSPEEALSPVGGGR